MLWSIMCLNLGVALRSQIHAPKIHRIFPSTKLTRSYSPQHCTGLILGTLGRVSKDGDLRAKATIIARREKVTTNTSISNLSSNISSEVVLETKCSPSKVVSTLQHREAMSSRSRQAYFGCASKRTNKVHIIEKSPIFVTESLALGIYNGDLWSSVTKVVIPPVARCRRRWYQTQCVR